MNFIFELAHPKHFHQFRHIIEGLKLDHQVLVIARNKEVLWKLLDENNVPYIRFFHTSSRGLVKKLAFYLSSFRKLLSIARKHKADVFISKASLSTVILKIFRRKCKTLIFPDSEGVWLTNHIVCHFSDYIITPDVNGRNFGPRHRRIPGIFENSYLLEEHLKQDKSKLADKFGFLKGKTALLRFVGWNANHDITHSGFTDEQKRSLVDLFLKYSFRVIISAESSLPDELSKYRNPFPPSEIHSVLKACDYYVGDSQTMASEAALLGLKSFRCNSMVGRIPLRNFIFLEDKHLLRNFSNFDELYRCIEDEITGKTDFFRDVTDYWKEYGDQNEVILELINKIIKP